MQWPPYTKNPPLPRILLSIRCPITKNRTGTATTCFAPCRGGGSFRAETPSSSMQHVLVPLEDERGSEGESEIDREEKEREDVRGQLSKTMTSLQWPAPRGRVLDKYARFFDTLLLLSQSTRRRHHQHLTALVSLQVYIKGYSAPLPLLTSLSILSLHPRRLEHLQQEKNRKGPERNPGLSY
jgi:hypothetical protein